jgi:hypothetical protein
MSFGCRSPQSTSANIALTATHFRRKARGGAGEEDEVEREVWDQGEEGRVQEEEGGGEVEWEAAHPGKS